MKTFKTITQKQQYTENSIETYSLLKELTKILVLVGMQQFGRKLCIFEKDVFQQIQCDDFVIKTLDKGRIYHEAM